MSMKVSMLFCVYLGDFRTGVFIQLQPFRHAGNWYVDVEKREGGEGEKRGKEEEEGMEKQNENKKGKPLNRRGVEADRVKQGGKTYRLISVS